MEDLQKTDPLYYEHIMIQNQLHKIISLIDEASISDKEKQDLKEKAYEETSTEKNNKGIAIKLFIFGLIISIIICGVGFLKQNNANKTNEERKIWS